MDQIELDNIIIPYYEEKGEKWYPVRYVTEKFLLKGNPQLHKNEEYKQFICKYVIDYTFKGTAPQETYCMNKEGWNKYLSECKLNKNKNIDKIKRYNILCDYFGCESKYIEKAEVELYDDYIKDCIAELTNYKYNIEYKECSNCGRNLPIHKNFFPKDDRVKSGFLNVCKMCNIPNNYIYFQKDNQAREVYNIFGNDAYILYKQDLLQFYNKYVHNQNDFKLHIGNTEETKLFISRLINYHYKNKLITNENIDREFIYKNFKIKMTKNYININKIHEECTDNDCKIRPYKYPNYNLGVIDFERGKEILNTYLQDNKIEIENIFNYNYNGLLKKCRLQQFNNNILDFVVKYYDYEYAGYKFKIASVNYYKNKEVRIFDMKWLVEKDLKLEIPKIPLYITKTLLHEQYRSLYLVLNRNCYEGNLFKWINECYPNKFIELDFNINPYRNLFDSFEEAQVDRILRTKCDNVVYNIRNSDNEVTILNMKPDWLILGEKGTILVEYFGLYANGGNEYKEKMEKKYIKYGELLKIGYKHLYIYPHDLKSGFQGLNKKLDAIQ